MTWYVAWISLAALFVCVQTQRDETETVCRLQADIAFVVDSSGSINDRDSRNWGRIKDFLKSIVDRLDIGEMDTRVALVKFSNRGSLEFNLAEHFSKTDIKRGIDRMRYLEGNTNTSGGLYVMLHQVFNKTEASGDRPEVADRAIVITDGVSTRDKKQTIPYAREAKRKGIKMMAVGVTDEINMDELRGIASPPDAGVSNIYEVEDFDKLPEILDGLLTQTCYTLTTTTAATTTSPLPRSPECEESADLVIILDSSGSVGETNFNLVKTWVRDLILQLDVENNVVNIGLLVYADEEELIFHMDQYTDRKDMVDAVDGLKYLRGTTNTADALKYARDTMFTRGNGDRQDVKNIILMVTNGDSDDREKTILEAKMAKDEGIHILLTVIGNWFTMEEMNGIASYPYSQNRMHLDSHRDLDEDFKETIQELICNRVDECSSNPCRNAIRCVDAVGYFTCQCSSGYGGATCNDRCEEPADIVFALDASGSIGRQNFETMVDFVRSIVQGMRIGNEESSGASRVGLITFSDDVHRQLYLNEYSEKYHILNAFPPYYRGGATDTAGAIRYMREEMFTSSNGDQSNVKNIGVIITDGRSNDEGATWREAVQARQAGINLITVGVGRSIRMRELQAVASFPNEEGKNVLIADDFDDLEDLRDSLVDAVCNNEDECSDRPCRNSGTCTDLINGYECSCSDRYTGRICDRECSGEADVAFVIDASGSIRSQRFHVVLDFVKAIVQELEVGEDKTRVAALSWSDTATVEFKLDTYFSKQDVLTALSYIQYQGDRTHTAAALTMLRTDVFDASGDREDVPNFAYVVTDGNSNINQQLTIKEAVAAKVSDTHIMTVSVGKDLNNIELRGIVSDPTDVNMFSVESFVDLEDLSEMMPGQICNDVNECRSRPCMNGGTCVDAIQKYICICPEGRTGVNCQLSCSEQLDVAFILDLSGSTESEYQRTIQFTKRVIHGLDMNFGRARVGVVTFGDKANLEFYLNSYSAKLEILTAIAFVPNRGRTNTQEAISMAHSEIFSQRWGDRRGVQNVAILVTDGYSNVDKTNTIPEADRAKRDDVAIYVVAVGDAVDMGEVTAIAGTSSGSSEDYVFRLQDDGDIDDVADDLASELCQ